MQFNVAQLLKEPIGSSRRYEVDGEIDLDGDGTASPVHGQVEMTRTDRGILVRAAVTTEIDLGCSRCLTSYRQPLTVNFEEEFFPTVDVTSGVPLPRAEGGLFVIDAQHLLDLTEAVRQYALMAIPMKPLCRPDCAGICPGCGRNINSETCVCPPRTIDPRWAALIRSSSERKGKS